LPDVGRTTPTIPPTIYGDWVWRARLDFALQLLAPRKFGRRGLLGAANGARLHLAIAHVGRMDQPVRRDVAVRQRKRAPPTIGAEQALALTEQHGERERADFIDQVGGKQRVHELSAALRDERRAVFLFQPSHSCHARAAAGVGTSFIVEGSPMISIRIASAVFAAVVALGSGVLGQTRDRASVDAGVKRFLDERAGRWRDLNVPPQDGQLLHDLIAEHGYTRALEIGTSTGHSGVWIAWALSKTGGRLITVEIDAARHEQARANFEAAGLSAFIDARLGNAHEIVPDLEGPFDFVFSDADKDWYPNYFKAVFPKLAAGGCYATHNISERGRGRGTPGSREYLELLRRTPGADTTVDERGGGMAITCKRST
jgi:predicted O-methyltransferase YrrM